MWHPKMEILKIDLPSLRANLIKEIFLEIALHNLTQIPMWYDVSSKQKYCFLLKSHIISTISHNLHFHPDEINESISPLMNLVSKHLSRFHTLLQLQVWGLCHFVAVANSGKPSMHWCKTNMQCSCRKNQVVAHE